ncbi:MAG: holo-ACP synthase [Desulfomonile sp.]|nr:holo-ACP synthase [Desulfomonile sp.]
MILGIGVDLVEVSRMERTLNSPWANRLVRRVFSAEEVAVCKTSARPAEGFAARFAAKEAFAKAIGTGFSQGVTPGQVMVKGSERERPTIVLDRNALAIARSLGVERIHLSLSHTSRAACAYVVIEGRGQPR